MHNTAKDPTENVYAFVPAAVYRRKKAPPPPFSEDEILDWADAHQKRHGCWPIQRSGPVAEAPGETWAKVDSALRKGGRGLLGNSSLALLLFRHRGRRHPLHLARFTEEQILEWADAHHARHGAWPGGKAGVIPECPTVTWDTVQAALYEGRHGLPGGATLTGLLAEKRGAERGRRKTMLSEAQILAWADEHFQRTGEWPQNTTGRIEPSADETWSKVHSALSKGGRGLPGGSSLAQLLQQERGTSNAASPPPLVIEDILAWADAHYERWGAWPVSHSKQYPERNAIPESPGLNWSIVNQSLSTGHRGLSGGSSLARLLEERRGRQHRLHLAPYTEAQILAWADAHFARHSKWPVSHKNVPSEQAYIPESPGTTWTNINGLLRSGGRGLPGGSSLARLLEAHRRRRNRCNLVPLSQTRILKWADAFHRRTGAWPLNSSGAVRECPDSTWATLNDALRRGSRGLPGGTSLAGLLAQERNAANRHTQTLFTEDLILQWADAHFTRSGHWPQSHEITPLPECPDVNWRKVENALRLGLRGMPGGSSIATLLEEKRGRRNTQNLRPFSEPEVLAWADAFHNRTGQWPAPHSGPIAEQPDDTWQIVDTAFMAGLRGMPGGSSLPRLLHERRGVFNKAFQPPLTEDLILQWADEHFTRTGDWPHCNTKGKIEGTPGDNWKAISNAVYKGLRGLPGGTSLALLLQEHRGRRSQSHQPPLSVEQILAWADAHHARTGEWPECRNTGRLPVTDAPHENWQAINTALQKGLRGLPGGPTLAQLLQQQRGKRNLKGLPPLTIGQILEWADAHFARTGKWPRTIDNTPIPGTLGEKWCNITQNLQNGDRGLPGGSSLALLLEQERGMRVSNRPKPLSIEQIADWARAHRERTGAWPTRDSGDVEDTTWSAIDNNLYKGQRGLPKGLSLYWLIAALEEGSLPDFAERELPRAA